MSFATTVREDLLRVLSGRSCCRGAELAAFLRVNGHMRLSGGELSLSLRLENAALARKIFTLAKSSGLITQLSTKRKAPTKKNPGYVLRISAQAALEDFLAKWALKSSGPPAASLVEEECCKRSYLRGAYLATGYISRPEGAYHLEISLADFRMALFLQRLLYDFQIKAKLTRRKGLIILYLKEGEQISRFLNVIGSHRSLLEFESTRVDKEVRNHVNRLVNCDNANLDKTIEAAQKQIKRIQVIERKLGLSTLSPPLREAALLRLEYPEATLSELSALSGLGRSAINHRLRRLLDIADELESGPPKP